MRRHNENQLTKISEDNMTKMSEHYQDKMTKISEDYEDNEDDTTKKSEHNKDKLVFRCRSCMFFPTQIQLQTYFLNADTFKCPNCHQLSSFNQTQFTLLNTHLHLQLQSQTYLHTQSKPSIINNQASKHTNNQTRSSQKSSIKATQKNTILIRILKGQWILEHLYLNPLNPELTPSLNIPKSQILTHNQMLFFCIHNQVLKNLNHQHKHKYSNTSSASMLYHSQKRYKYSLRKVLKIQHLLYCLDLYIQALSTTMAQNNNQGNQQSFEIVVEIIEQNKPHQDQRQPVPIKLLKQFKFTLNQYKTLQRSFSHSSKHNIKEQSQFSPLSNQISNEQKQRNNQLQQSIRQFLQSIYLNQFQKQTNSVENPLVQDIQQQIRPKVLTILSNKFDMTKLNKLVEWKRQTQTNERQIQKKQLLVHNLYIQSLQAKSSKQPANIIDSIYKTQLVDKLFISHTSLYIPHCQQPITLNHLMNKVVSSLNSRTHSFTLQSESTAKNGKMYSPQGTRNQSGQLKSKFPDKGIFQPQIKSDKKIQPQQSPIEMNTFVYWKVINKGENDESPIKHHKISVNSLNKIMKPHTPQISIAQINKTIHSKINQIEQQILLILKAYEGQTVFSEDIKIDRLYSQFDKKQFYYVFSYEQIRKQNFQQLDFLDQHYLPEQLKGYSNTYQKLQQEPQNPFRKQNHRVYITNQQQQNTYDFQSSDQQFQTL